MTAANRGRGVKIVEGKFYRTTEGQKVGPMRRDEEAKDSDMCPWDYSGSQWFFGGDGKSHGGEPDLIAEWADEPVLPPSPVRTVTRKEIVPGRYGAVGVAVAATVGKVLVEVGGAQSAAELRAAAATFIELADALDEAA